MTPPPALRMPAAVEFVLTRRVPCALLAVVMFSAAWWLPCSLQDMQLLAWMFALLAIGIHLLTPGLFALITLGGGSGFALQVAALSAVGVGLAAGMQPLVGLLMLLLYGVMPIAAGRQLGAPRGWLRRPIEH